MTLKQKNLSVVCRRKRNIISGKHSDLPFSKFPTVSPSFPTESTNLSKKVPGSREVLAVLLYQLPLASFQCHLKWDFTLNSYIEFLVTLPKTDLMIRYSFIFCCIKLQMTYRIWICVSLCGKLFNSILSECCMKA